jgi:hypothetical protein
LSPSPRCPTLYQPVSFWRFCLFIFFFFWWHWGLSGPYACYIGALPLEPLCQHSPPSLFVMDFFQDRVSGTICLGLVLKWNSPDLCLLQSWDYRCEPPVPSIYLFFNPQSITQCMASVMCSENFQLSSN